MATIRTKEWLRRGQISIFNIQQSRVVYIGISLRWKHTGQEAHEEQGSEERESEWGEARRCDPIIAALMDGGVPVGVSQRAKPERPDRSRRLGKTLRELRLTVSRHVARSSVFSRRHFLCPRRSSFLSSALVAFSCRLPPSHSQDRADQYEANHVVRRDRKWLARRRAQL